MAAECGKMFNSVAHVNLVTQSNLQWLQFVIASTFVTIVHMEPEEITILSRFGSESEYFWWFGNYIFNFLLM